MNQHSLGDGIYATYHSNQNTAVMAPDFFARNPITQSDTIAHEYFYSTPDNINIVNNATLEQAGMQYEVRPWESPALSFGRAFGDRFGYEIFQLIRGR